MLILHLHHGLGNIRVGRKRRVIHHIFRDRGARTDIAVNLVRRGRRGAPPGGTRAQDKDLGMHTSAASWMSEPTKRKFNGTTTAPSLMMP